MTLKVSHSGPVSEAVERFVPELVKDKVASRLFAKDFTLWGKQAEAESAIRLGWVDAAKNSLVLVPELKQLRAQLVERGLTRVVLCGMGGSSLAPEVITKTFGCELVVLDSTGLGSTSSTSSPGRSPLVLTTPSSVKAAIQPD
jgi:glucose-6-phosphate isomerase